jgi:hypothetical protein
MATKGKKSSPYVMSVKEFKEKYGSGGAYKKKGKKRGSPEHDEQVTLFRWASVMSAKYPELELLFAIPNGAYYFGSWGMANKMKAEGLKSGVPDVFLPVKKTYKSNGRVQYCGLWIEMKVGSNKPSDTQERWIALLIGQGYKVEVCYGSEEAIEVICDYLNVNEK